MDPHHGKHEPKYSEVGDPHDLPTERPSVQLSIRTHLAQVLLLIAGILLGFFSAETADSQPPPLGITVRAKIDRVIDGDTVVATINWPVVLRLKDCWAPETRGPEKEAGELAKSFMQSLAPVGQSCIISVDSHDAKNLADLMTFGRVVANVWTDGSDISLSEEMIMAGHAERGRR